MYLIYFSGQIIEIFYLNSSENEVLRNSTLIVIFKDIKVIWIVWCKDTKS